MCTGACLCMSLSEQTIPGKIPSVHYKRRQHGDTHAQSSTHSQRTMAMKMLLGCSLCLLLLLSCLSQAAEARTLHLDSCSVTVHTHELRKYFSDIRLDAIAKDNEIGVKLLDKSLIRDVQEGQTCCFVRLLLRFYVERVFSNYASTEPQLQRSSSALANAFVIIRRDIHKCHCQCKEETQRTIDSVMAEFTKLQIQPAVQKAVGELGTVLEWLDQKTHA
ncbi:interleukin 19 like [Betta splendens]|uniref:Interleukin family protein n=1 Tax=Betta splendens TaxID=158456 RepID=A0A6P7MNI3_BETSP|nr:interleukin 19 like [Betta splendens]